MLVAGISVVSAVTLSGCGEAMTRYSANRSVEILGRVTQAIDAEPLRWLARAALLSELKRGEGLVLASPKNAALLVLVSRNYARFADDFLHPADSDSSDKIVVPPRSSTATALPPDVVQARRTDFLTRAKLFATTRLALDWPDIAQALSAGTDARLDQLLDQADPDDHLSALYWLAFSWGRLLDITPNPQLRTRVDKLMGWVRAHDPAFEHAGPVLYFAARHAGDDKASRRLAHADFDEATRLTRGLELRVKLLWARYLASVENDQASAHRTLREIDLAPPNLSPQRALANTLAQARARYWLAHPTAQAPTPRTRGTSPPPN